MIKIAYNESRGDTYAYEYLKGNFDIITFMKYKRHNIAIPNIILNDGDMIKIEDFSNKQIFWNRDRGPIEIKYKKLDEDKIRGQGFELYYIVGENENE